MTTYNGGGLAIGPFGSEYAEFTYDSVGNTWYSNIPLVVNGDVISTGNISANGNINLNNIAIAGNLTAGGNITALGTSISAVGFSSIAGNTSVTQLTSSGNITSLGSIVANSIRIIDSITVANSVLVTGVVTSNGGYSTPANVYANNINVTNTLTLQNLIAQQSTVSSVQAGSFTISGNTISSTDSTINVDPYPGGVGGNFNISAANTTVNGAIYSTGSITATEYYGDGSNLTNLPTVMPSGSILMWGTVTPPSGYFLCNGQAISRSTNPDLFAILGTTYGAGDGSTTFNLPNFTNYFPVGAGNAYSAGSTGGSTDAIVVSHTHTATVTDPGHSHLSNAVGLVNPDINWTGTGGVDYRNSNDTQTGTATTGITVTNDITGSAPTNANLPPYLAIYFIIKS